MNLFRKKPKPEVVPQSAPLNDWEYEQLKRDVIERWNRTGGSVLQLQSELAQLEQARERRPEPPEDPPAA